MHKELTKAEEQVMQAIWKVGKGFANEIVAAVEGDAAYNTAILFDYSDAFAIYDQDDSSPNSPLMVNAVAGANYNFPYHGKAAPAGKSLSEVAKGLGWSDSVWDFSGEIPVIKADATFVPVEDVNGEGGIGDWDENKIN